MKLEDDKGGAKTWAAEIIVYGLSFLYYSSLVADAVAEMKEEPSLLIPVVVTN